MKYALALALQLDGDDALTNSVTFHTSPGQARLKVMETLLSYTAPHIKTVEDFIKEMNVTRDLEGVNVDSMTAVQLIDWVRIEALGEDCKLAYDIKKVA